MSNVSNKPMAIVWCAAAAASLLLFVPLPSFADIGVPMLAVMAVPMWLSLLVIIPIEALIANRIIGLNKLESLRLSALANLFSTFIGIPVTWILLLIGEIVSPMVVGVLSTILRHPLPKEVRFDSLDPGFKCLFVFFGCPWLLPIDSDLYWMVPVAALLLCVPFFFASVWSENFVARKMVKLESQAKVTVWAWKANVATYILMVLLIVGLLIMSMMQHDKTANDDEHRDVDFVSAESLWNISVARAEQFKRSMNSRSFEKNDSDPIVQEMRRVSSYLSAGRYENAKTSLEKDVLVEDSRLDKNTNPWFYPMYDLRLGSVYQKLGEPEKAEKFYEHVLSKTGKLEMDDCRRDAMTALAELCSKQQKEQRAEDLFRQASSSNYASDGQEKAVARFAEYLCSHQRFKEAEQLIQDDIKKKEKSYHRWEFPTQYEGALALALGNCYLAEGNLSLAEHWIKQSLRGKERLSDAAESYANVLKKAGKDSEAKIWQKRATEATGLYSQ